ncbi:MAG: hypothetical protein WCG04_06840 [Alphaproteobacteria bacterium]
MRKYFKKHAHLMAINLMAILFIDGSFAMNNEYLEFKEAGESCFYQQDPVPAQDDPYQSQPLAISQNLLGNTFPKDEEKIAFYKDGLVDMERNPRRVNMQKIGNFVIDYKFSLGYGDKGYVKLSQHVDTRIFVAVKIVNTKAPEDYPDVLSLKKLKRLYGLFRAPDPKGMEKIFIFMPLANGISSHVLGQGDSEFPVKATVEHGLLKIDKLEVALNLVNSFIKEVEYFAKSGYFQADQGTSHVYACNDFQDVCIVDYDGRQSEGPINESEWDVRGFRFNIINLLGIHEQGVFGDWNLLPAKKISKLKGPKHIIKFLKAIDNNNKGSYSLQQLKLDFKALKLACEKQ